MAEQHAPHDMAAVQAKLDNFQCQLVSLEMSLRSVVRMQVIPERDYQARAEVVERMRRRLDELRSVLSDPNKGVADSDIGFPRSDQCSIDELRICDDYLTRRLASCERLYGCLTELQRWVLRALGGADSIRSIFRLSKLKKWLQGVENDAAKTDLEEKELERMTERLSLNIKSREDSSHLSGNLEALVRIFREIDTLGYRISNLQSSLARHDERIVELKEWLARHEAEIDVGTRDSDIPTLQKIQEAKDELTHLSGDHERENRLTLARRFVESCLPSEDGALNPPLDVDVPIDDEKGPAHAH